MFRFNVVITSRKMTKNNLIEYITEKRPFHSLIDAEKKEIACNFFDKKNKKIDFFKTIAYYNVGDFDFYFLLANRHYMDKIFYSIHLESIDLIPLKEINEYFTSEISLFVKLKYLLYDKNLNLEENIILMGKKSIIEFKDSEEKSRLRKFFHYNELEGVKEGILKEPLEFEAWYLKYLCFKGKILCTKKDDFVEYKFKNFFKNFYNLNFLRNCDAEYFEKWFDKFVVYEGKIPLPDKIKDENIRIKNFYSQYVSIPKFKNYFKFWYEEYINKNGRILLPDENLAR